jgi:hypothetical protein
MPNQPLEKNQQNFDKAWSLDGSTTKTNYGYVSSIIEGNFSIASEEGNVTALKASSCLILPEIGDYVAYLFDGKKRYLISVLERKSADPLSIVSQQGISIEAPEIKLTGKQKLHFSGAIGRAAFGSLHVASINMDLDVEKAETRVKSLSHFGKTISGVFNTILTRASTALRVIDGSDIQKAKQTTIEAENILSIKGEFTSITAKADVKIDGERVHVG